MRHGSPAKLSLCSFCSLPNVVWAVVVWCKRAEEETSSRLRQGGLIVPRSGAVLYLRKVSGNPCRKAAEGSVSFPSAKLGFVGAAGSRTRQEFSVPALGVLGGYPSSSAPLWWGGMDAAAVLGVVWGRCELKRPRCSTAELTLWGFFFWCNEKVGVEQPLSICFVLLLPSCRCLLGFEDFFWFFSCLCITFFSLATRLHICLLFVAFK